jgi:UDP-N-acetylmuramoyl-tripeptide--D-alanyl-D-alanine ligase
MPPIVASPLATGPAALRWGVVALCLVATGVAGVRWLRVAQREHYLPDATASFAIRWWCTQGTVLSRVLAVVAAGGLVVTSRWALAGVVVAVAVGLGPDGLSLRGRSAPLAWTRRLRTLAVVSGACAVLLVGVSTLFGVAPLGAAAVAVAAPALVDLGCLLTAPFERRAAGRFVTKATERLGRIAPRVVAITGSYGKTSTKQYVAHLVGGSRAVVASPASFNNRAGLARAVNEHLVEGTEVFVAEMGTYGPGEIRELCSWITPEIAAITAIGPVHLERFGSEERIVEAKSEILDGARVAVLNVDDERLAALADRTEAAGTRVVRCSGSPLSDTAPEGSVDSPLLVDVRVFRTDEGLVVIHGEQVLTRDVLCTGQPGNIAVAVAIALELGVTPEQIASRLGSLPAVSHRLELSTAPSGCRVLDDTYNANPAGARAALKAIEEAAGEGGRRVVVTPGMVELGDRQAEENALFAAAAAAECTDLLVVGRTNRRALLEGARRGSAKNPGCAIREVPTREAAVAWVRDHLGAGDVVLYENDLPDNYP